MSGHQYLNVMRL